MLYRIFTEDVNRQTVVHMVSQSFDGFTVYSTIGYWKGEREHSLTIEISGKVSKAKVFKLAKAIKIYNKQQNVLIQMVKESSKLV